MENQRRVINLGEEMPQLGRSDTINGITISAGTLDFLMEFDFIENRESEYETRGEDWEDAKQDEELMARLEFTQENIEYISQDPVERWKTSFRNDVPPFIEGVFGDWAGTLGVEATLNHPEGYAIAYTTNYDYKHYECDNTESDALEWVQALAASLIELAAPAIDFYTKGNQPDERIQIGGAVMVENQWREVVGIFDKPREEGRWVMLLPVEGDSLYRSRISLSDCAILEVATPQEWDKQKTEHNETENA